MKNIIKVAALSAAIFPCLYPLNTSLAENSETPALMVITPNRTSTDIKEVGSSVSVISSKEIEQKRQLTVSELLRSTPGIDVVRTGGYGSTTSVFIRGANSDHTLVLVDGTRVNDNSSGLFNFADLNADNIERIEIIRGPQSVLYGSDAIGGVINIITKQASEGTKLSASAEGGSQSTQRYSANMRYADTLVNSSTNISILDTDGISAADSKNGNSEKDSHENITFSTRNSLSFLEDGNVTLSLRQMSTKSDIDGFDFGVGPVDDLNYKSERDLLSSTISITKPLAEWITPTIELGFTDDDTKGSDPDTEFNNFSIDNQTLSVTSKLELFKSDNGVTTLGHTFDHRESVNKGNFDEQRDISSIFVQREQSWNDNFFITLGLRHDIDSDFGEKTTYRLTNSYILRESGTRLHASYATGFKAPSFNELYFPNFGNPNLDAETSRGYDFGIEQSVFNDSALFDVTFFQNEIDDLITFDTDTFLAENIAKAKIIGLETTLSAELINWLSSSISYTYTDSEDKETGSILARRPRHRGSVNLTFSPSDNINAIATLIVVNSRRDSTGVAMDNYEKVDLTIDYAATENIKPFVRIENLFDEDYQDVPGYGTLGFSVYAGIEVSS